MFDTLVHFEDNTSEGRICTYFKLMFKYFLHYMFGTEGTCEIHMISYIEFFENQVSCSFHQFLKTFTLLGL